MSVAPSATTSAAAGRGAGPKSVEAVIVDDAGNVVAQRTLTDRSAKVCLPLARAVGAWASLVLDSELARAKDDDGSQPTPAVAPSGAPASSATSTAVETRAPRQDRDTGAGTDGEPTPRRSIELGTMGYLHNGLTYTGGFGGVSPFVTIEVAPSWVLRMALALGRSTGPILISESQTATLSHVGGRADFCRRIPGNYIERRGIEADMCWGVEGGMVTSDPTGTASAAAEAAGGDAARLGLGPSATLRGELGAGIALEVRGLLGANLLTKPIRDEAAAPLVFAAAELGVSVRLP